MKELLRTNDPVHISWAETILNEAGIETVVFDQDAAVIEGSINAIQRRVMVPDDDLERARQLLAEAGDSAGPSG